MIRLKSIRGANFKSFKEFDFEIKNGLWVVKGQNHDDDYSDSNGSGKSTLFADAPFWCLTGKTTEGLESADDVVNFTTKKDCWVELLLDSPNGEIKVKRTRKHTDFGNNLFVEINGQSVTCHKVADTQARLDDIIKVPSDTLRSTIIMSSDITNRFSDLTPSGRVALLESVRDYKVWEKFRDESKTNLNSINSDISKFETDKASKSGSIETIKGVISSLAGEYDEEDKKELNKDLLPKLEDKIKLYEDNIKTIELKIQELEPHVESLSEAVNSSMENASKINGERLRLTHEKSLEEGKKLRYETQLEGWNKEWNSNGICPTCGKPYDIPEQKKRDLEIWIKGCKEEIAKCDENIKKFEDDLNKLGSFTVSADSVLVKEKNIAESELSDYRIKLVTLNKELSNLKIEHDKLESDINTHESKLKSILDKIKNYKLQLASLFEEIKDIDNKVGILNEDKRVYQFYYDCLGPRGNLRPYLLSRDIDYLNKSLKYYSKVLYSSLNISLTKPTIDSNKIDILIKTESGMIKPISVLSKGERKRADLCIQFAIYDLIKSTAMFDTNILIMDEIFDGLDVSGLTRVVELLEERSEFIPSVYIISHNPNIYDLINDRVIIEKINDFSKIKYETGNSTTQK